MTAHVFLHKRANRNDASTRSGAHIPMQHKLAPSPGPGFQEPAELLCASEIVEVILECIFEHGKLAVYIDFETLFGCVMDYRCVLCITVLVFGHDVCSLAIFGLTLFCAKN